MIRKTLITAARDVVQQAIDTGWTIEAIANHAGTRPVTVRRLLNDEHLPNRGNGRVCNGDLRALVDWQR